MLTQVVELDETSTTGYVTDSLEAQLRLHNIPMCSEAEAFRHMGTALASTKRYYGILALALGFTTVVLLSAAYAACIWRVPILIDVLTVLTACSLLAGFLVLTTTIEWSRVPLIHYRRTIPATVLDRVNVLWEVMPEADLVVHYIKVTTDPILAVHYKDEDGMAMVFIAAIWEGNRIIV